MCTFSGGGDSLDSGLLVHTAQGSQSQTATAGAEGTECLQSSLREAGGAQKMPGCPLLIPLPAPEEGREWGAGGRCLQSPSRLGGSKEPINPCEKAPQGNNP